MKKLLLKSLRDLVGSIAAAVFLIVAVGMVVGSMFGIAALVDAYSQWWLAAYIPWLYLVCVWGNLLAPLAERLLL